MIQGLKSEELINAIQSICCFILTITPGWNYLRMKVLFLSKQPVHPMTLMAVMMLECFGFFSFVQMYNSPMLKICHPQYRKPPVQGSPSVSLGKEGPTWTSLSTPSGCSVLLLLIWRVGVSVVFMT